MGRFDLIIRGGTVHTAAQSRRADVGIARGKIAAVGRNLRDDGRGARVIDAEGMDVIPGCVDVHVHLALPFCGTVSCDDFDSGTRAAAAGCVTTVIDFAIPGDGQTLREGHEAWQAKARGKAYVDYTWHAAITKRQHLAEIPAMIGRGVTTFKEFMIYESEGWASDDAMMFATLELMREHGAMLLVHAESSRVLDLLIQRRHTKADMKKYGARLHPMTRPNFVEAEAIERAIHWCDVTGGRLYVVHMSTGEGADLIAEAQGRGVPVMAETCAQYLVLDDSVFDSKRDGHLFACCPQVKKRADIARLWRAIERGAGEVEVVSTDTCSFTRKQKAMWKGDWTRIPMGLPGLETLVPIMYTKGVRAGRISMNRMVELCATKPAKVMGLGGRKGDLAPGFDADIAIIDPKRTIEVDWRNMQSRCDWSPYQGMRLGGFARTTLSRGAVVVDDYKVVGRRGHGRFLKRGMPETKGEVR